MNNKLWNLVSENDKMLYELASYYESKGFTIPIVHDKVMNRFSEFKTRIRLGSMTLEQLEIDVLKKFGVTEGAEKISAPFEALPDDIKEMIDKLSVGVE